MMTRISVRHPIDQMIGEEIKRLRRSAKLTQRDLAAQLDVSYQQVQKYELAVNRLPASTLFEIAKIFGVSVSDLYLQTGEEATIDPLLESALELVRLYQSIPENFRPLIKSAAQSFAQEGFRI
ncbi:helix-turn-helix domain-containing protein [Paracoccus aminophilus]|nr:helix-turn-helix transcriptional regulator [Paracoccus aminophilus]